MGIQLKVKKPEGSEFKLVELCDSLEQLNKMTVADMKERITTQLTLGSTDGFRVVYRTEELVENAFVTTYGIKHMSTIHTVLYLDGGM